jgi:hypothetical protein
MDSKYLAQSVKKPLNAFFMYRKSITDEIIRDHKVSKSHEISRIAGQRWAAESNQVKEYFAKLSADAFARHKELYPEYIWPSKKNSKVKAKRKAILNKLKAEGNQESMDQVISNSESPRSETSKAEFTMQSKRFESFSKIEKNDQFNSPVSQTGRYSDGSMEDNFSYRPHLYSFSSAESMGLYYKEVGAANSLTSVNTCNKSNLNQPSYFHSRPITPESSISSSNDYPEDKAQCGHWSYSCPSPDIRRIDSLVNFDTASLDDTYADSSINSIFTNEDLACIDSLGFDKEFRKFAAQL